jgi:outer membrane protein assembly factor BamB
MDDQSRVIAVAHPNNRLLWISDSVPGQIQGTPIISQSSKDPGRYIFVTHNMNVTLGDPIGGFSMIQADADGKLVFTEVAGTSRRDPTFTDRIETLAVPYGPLGVAHKPNFGRYPGGEGNSNDLLIWSTSSEDGEGPNGYTRAFQLPLTFAPEFAATQTTVFLREVRWNAVAKPALSSNGYNLFFGVRASGVRGWSGVPDFSENGNIAFPLQQDPNEPRLPVMNAPVFSTLENVIFMSAAAPYFYGIDVNTGNILWQFQGEAKFNSRAQVSSDDFLVYTTQVNGRVTAHLLNDGSPFWSITCADIGGSACFDDLAAEFSVSPYGLVLYYGDRFGNVKAIQIAESSVPTAAPTLFQTAQTSGAPTGEPTPVPTPLAPTPRPTTSPTAMNSAKPTTSSVPSDAPSFTPTSLQASTEAPTASTGAPTASTEAPTASPTKSSTAKPSETPTRPPEKETLAHDPTSSPTSLPTISLVTSPTASSNTSSNTSSTASTNGSPNGIEISAGSRHKSLTVGFGVVMGLLPVFL